MCIRDRSWTAEVAIPFETLGVRPGKPGRAWSFNLTRSARDPDDASFLEDTAWSPTGERSSHVPNMFGYIWLDGAPAGTDDRAYAEWHAEFAPVEPAPADAKPAGGDRILAAVSNSKGSVEAGGELWILSADTGARIETCPLPAAPAYDGLAVVDGRIIVTLQDASVLCLEAGGAAP